MKKDNQHIDIEIDKITNSVENLITGDRFLTEVLLLEKADLKNITKEKGWLFNWKEEYQLADRDVYKLIIVGNPLIVQGLLCITERLDHVCMRLIESAPFNLGKHKVY